MLIQEVNDIHLEFGPIQIKNAGANVLVLAGDICIIADLLRSDASSKVGIRDMYFQFFERVCKEFEHVIYVFGNHEFWGYFIDMAVQNARLVLSEFKNLHILQNNYIDIDGVRFIGTTLWTDMNKNDPLTIAHGRNWSDFNRIRVSTSYSKFHAHQALKEHIAAKDAINVYSKYHEKVVVVSHHAPCQLSIHETFKDDIIMNGFYYSELSEFIMDRPQIKQWFHGHMHNSFDYMLDGCRVICNPRGYEGYELNPSFNPNLIIEV